MAADRIRVLPGSILSLPSPPPPPSQPPPQPVHLCKIAVIGDSSSGKTSVVDKFLLRKSCASPLHSNNHGGIISGTNGSVGGVQWCNASTTSQGTFGSAVGASLGPAAVEATLAEYSKKDIALKKKQQLSKSSTTRQSPSMEEMTTTCVRAQVWDINVPQSAIITSQDGNNYYCNGSSISVNSTSSSSSIATSTPLQYNNNDNAISNLAPLLPLLKRINGIILTCQCPSPPSFTAQQQQQQHPNNNNDLSYNSNMSIHSHNSNHNQGSSNLNSYNSAGNNNNSVEWQELDLLEVQIANWVNFISRYVVVNDAVTAANAVGDGGTDRKESNNNNNKIYIMLTFADLAISQYSPNEWMRLSVKMEEICTKFEMVRCWRMGTCVTSVVDVGGDGESRSGGHDDDVGEATKQTRQQRQYGLFQRMAQQQQQMMEEMEDSVEALFIDMILMHLESG